MFPKFTCGEAFHKAGFAFAFYGPFDYFPLKCLENKEKTYKFAAQNKQSYKKKKLMGKKRMTQDELYQYFLEHNIIVKRLGELIGQSDSAMSNAFKHHIVNGKHHYFSAKKVALINTALPVMAREIASRIMVFNPANNISTVPSRCYDPECLPQLQNIGEYFILRKLTARILGWSLGKNDSIFCPANRNYGHISPSDVELINAELLAVAGMLGNIELLATPDGQLPQQTEAKRNPNNNKGTRTRMEQSFESNMQPWEDTSLDLLERYRLFHEQWSDGVLFFRVNGGYTVAQQDSDHLCHLDSSLQPYTDPATGLTTTWIGEDKFAWLMPQCVEAGHRIGVTNMY